MTQEPNNTGWQQNPDEVPGGEDMTLFERMYAQDGVGPVEQWAIRWPEGRMMTMDDQDAALLFARCTPHVRIVHRWVSPWSPPEAA